MKDPSFTIRDAYYNQLNGNLLHNGNEIGVYDGFAPPDVLPPYVILGAQTVIPREDTQCNFMSDCTIIVIVVTAFPAAEAGNKKYADSISNQITEIIKPAPGAALPLGGEFRCLKTSITGITTSTSQDKINKYHEKAIRFTHLIKEI